MVINVALLKWFFHSAQRKISVFFIFFVKAEKFTNLIVFLMLFNDV